MLVGITAKAAAHGLAKEFWANGMAQNTLFLAMLLDRLPDVTVCLVVNDEIFEAGEQAAIACMPLSAACERVDILIEMGVRFEAAPMNRFVERGGKIISYMAGNALAMNFEAVANRMPYGELFADFPYAAVWITPQHMRMNRSYAALTRGGHVCEVPHIWHPHFLLNAVTEWGNNKFHWRSATDSAQPWRIGVFDPTINVLKTFHLPLLVCEEASRREAAAIASVLLFSAIRFKDNVHFSELVGTLDLYRDGKIFAEDRHAVPGMLGQHVDAVVTHQWENNLNYLYWDVLYSGRPLIHNVRHMQDLGYYYPSFSPAEGGRILIEARQEHDRRAPAKRAAELEYLWGLSIDNATNQERYAALLGEVMETHL